jgi:transcriptional regulator with XRE-family HTH domain
MLQKQDNSASNLTLGQKFKFYRKRAGLCQQEVEILSLLASGTVSRIENNIVIPLNPTILAMAKTLGLDKKETADLLGVNMFEKDVV